MKHDNLAPLRKGEIIGGFLYLPMFLVGTSLLFSLLLGGMLALTGQMPDQETLVGQVSLYSSLMNLIVLVLIFHHFLRGQFKRLRDCRVGRLIGTIAIGYAIFLGGNLLTQGLTWLMDGAGISYENANQEAVEALLWGSPAAAFVSAVLCAPIVEELLFRGLIFGLIHKKSRALAYVVSMLLFSAAHVAAGLLSGEPLLVLALNLVTYLPMGFALAWTFERTRTIWAAILLHMLNNGLALVLLLAFGI